MDIKKTYKVFKNKKQRELLSDIILETLKECKTPEQRSVIEKLNDTIVRKWSIGALSLDEVDEITNCFYREKMESQKS